MVIKQSLPSWSEDAFEPHVSAETMYVHIHKLHKGYVDKLNAKFKNTDLLAQRPSVVLKDIEGYVDRKNQQFYRDMMGGNVAHTLLWNSITPDNSANTAKSRFLAYYDLSKEELRSNIVKYGLERFGSGWVWGCVDKDGVFLMYSTKNHDTPFMRKHTPIFCIDVWEHAYFLDSHGNKKKWLDYITTKLDYPQIDKFFSHAKKGSARFLDDMILGK